MLRSQLFWREELAQEDEPSHLMHAGGNRGYARVPAKEMDELQGNLR